MGSGKGRGGGGWFGGRTVIPGISSKSRRGNTGDDGVSKYFSGSRDQSFGTVARYGLFAKRRAYAYVKSMTEVRSPTI